MQQRFFLSKWRDRRMMYSLEELKTLGFLVGAAILGRILFYRSLALQGNFRQRLKVRFLRWLWELPVIMAIAIASFEAVAYFHLRESAGLVIAISLGFVGLETLKAWLDEYLTHKADRKRANDGN